MHRSASFFIKNIMTIATFADIIIRVSEIFGGNI